MAKKYTVLVGFNTPPDEARSEPGDEVFLDDALAAMLTDMGAVEHISVTQERVAEAERLAAEEAAAAEQAALELELEKAEPDLVVYTTETAAEGDPR